MEVEVETKMILDFETHDAKYFPPVKIIDDNSKVFGTNIL